jgi:hypothetical protein
MSQPAGYPHAGASGPLGQDFDKYSESAKEGKSYPSHRAIEPFGDLVISTLGESGFFE